jgi:hypothetical protein
MRRCNKAQLYLQAGNRESLQDSTLESFNLLRHQTNVHRSITLRSARKDQEKIFGFRGWGWETLLDAIANKAPCQRGQPPWISVKPPSLATGLLAPSRHIRPKLLTFRIPCITLPTEA